MARRGAIEIARALRDHHVRHSAQEAHKQPVLGVVKSVGSGTPGFTVVIADTGFVLEPNDLIVAHAVAQFDQDYGIKAGDSVTLVPLADGDYVATAVHSAAEATQRKTGGGMNATSGGPPAPGSGQDDDFGLDPATGAVYGPKTAGVWPTAPLPIGGGAGIRYAYSSDTAATDPTSGKVKFNSTTLASINTVRISETDFDGNNLAAWIATFDDSTTAAHRGTLIVVKDGAPTSILILDITGALTDNGTWDNFAVAVLASNGAFADGDFVRILFMRSGDTGGTGGAGPAGPAGPSGGAPLDYVQVTSAVSIAGTSGAPTTVVSGTSQAYAAGDYMVEAFSPGWQAGASDSLTVELWDGVTNLGQMAVFYDGTTAVGSGTVLRRKVTLTAATHQFIIKAYKVSTNGTVAAGPGGAGQSMPAYIKVDNYNNAGPVGPTGLTGPTGIPGPPGAGGVAIGATFDWVGPARSIPPLYLACFGQSVLRATYPELFAALCPLVSTFTVAVATPGVLTTPSAHGLVVGDAVFLTTTGALLTGLSANVTYYVMTVPSGTTFTLGTTRTIVAATGVATVTTQVNTSGTQSGFHSVFHAPHGVADATHFSIPDFRGRVGIGQDDMGGSAAGRLSWTKVPGIAGGEEAHLLLSGESGIAAHQHSVPGRNDGVGTSAGSASIQGNGNPPNWDPIGLTDTAGPTNAASSHNNVPPGIVVHKIIYAGPIDTSTADIHSFLLMGV